MEPLDETGRRILMGGLCRGLGGDPCDALFGPSQDRHRRQDRQSRPFRADAMEAVTCGWLSFVVVVSLAAQWLVGAWWIDGVGSLAIVYFLVKEGREAWSGDECECCA